jgi:membrane-bound lytic murein transglycosylase B
MPCSSALRFLLALPCALLAAQAPDALAHKPARPAPAARAHHKAELVAYGRRDDVLRFADDVAERRSLDPAWVRAALARARYVPTVARLILPPAGTAKNWIAYRARFVEPIRLRAGAAFWRANRAWLAKAEATYGVPPEIVVGIVGVETLYGQQMGNFRVIDALATLAFDFPPGRKDRSAFFRDELENYLVMCNAEGIEPLKLEGSYAGAMGMPQFMPSSVLKYAVDFDGDGRIDLHTDAADVIGSVAHYLAEFGWQRGLPTRFGVLAPVDTADRAALLAPDILPSFTAQQLAQHGARLDDAGLAVRLDANGQPLELALVELQNGAAAPTYVAGTKNFYAITRYNWSSYYAMAVIELGEAVRREVAQ